GCLRGGRLDGRGHGLGGGGRRLRRGGRFLDRDTEVGGDTGEAVGVALADGAGLPGSVAQIDLDHHQRRLGGEGRGRERRQDGAAVRVAEGGRRLDALEGLPRGVRARGDDDLLDARGHGGGVDRDRVGGGAAARAVGHTGAGG